MSKKIKQFISGFLAALMFSLVLPRVAPKVYAALDQYLILYPTIGGTIDANLQTTGISRISGYYFHRYNISATPDTGYNFTGWQCLNYATDTGYTTLDFADASSSNTQVTVYSKMENPFLGFAAIAANFALINSNVNVNYDSTMGTAWATKDSQTVTTADFGDSVTLQASPKHGYLFSRWRVVTSQGEQVYDSATVTFTMGDEEVNAYAEFVPITSNIIVTYDQGKGTAWANQSTADFGNSVSIQATPFEGYRFARWAAITPPDLQIANSTASSTTFTMPATDVNVKAEFEGVPHNVNVTYEQGKGHEAYATKNSEQITQAIIGDTVTLQATPGEGYRFKEWQVNSQDNITFTNPNGSNAPNATFTMGTHDVNATAVFEKLYDIEIIVTEGGTVKNINSENITSGTKMQLIENSAITLTATPTTGYTFNGWSITPNDSGIQFTNGTSSSDRTVKLQTGNKNATITANFSKISNNVTVESNGNGTANLLSPNPVDFGSTVNIQAIPNPGYSFGGWAITPEDSDIEFTNTTDTSSPNATFIMGLNPVTLTASFNPIYYDITLTQPDDQSQGTVQVDKNSAIIGDTVTLQATPGESYRFKEWIVTPSDAITFTSENGKYDSNATFTMGTENVNLQAVFEKVHTVRISKQGNGNIKDSNSTTIVPETELVIAENSDITLTATPAAGYNFNGWTIAPDDNDIQFLDNTSASSETAKFKIGSKDVTITANFDAIPNNVTVESSGHGTATLLSPSPTTIGSTVNISAVPDNGYQFEKWTISPENNDIEFTDNTNESSPNATFIMGSTPITLTADFKPINYNISVAVSDENHGMAHADKNSAIIGETVTLQATENENYRFKEWTVEPESAITFTSENGKLDPNATFIMGTENVSLTAVFERIYTVNAHPSIAGRGTIEINPQTATESSLITLTAKPSDGYYLKNWTVISPQNLELSSLNDLTTTFTMGTENVELEAVFEPITPIGIELDSETAKKVYNYGENLDIDGLSLKLKKSDGSEENIDIIPDMISGFDSYSPGKQTLTVTYGDFTDTYEVEVLPEEKITTDEPNENITDEKPYENPQENTQETTQESKKYDESTEITSDNTEYQSDVESQVAEDTKYAKSTVIAPQTGDDCNIIYWVSLMVVSVAGMGYTNRKKRSRNKKYPK